ncbi:hypothetical protein DM02DRAFT_167231 [Periconia macrospinosa]|uniref:Uncharacterized protein n=1 Tax=Periconia macrospinosa TaxID=97972 RepID=A0A2V1E1V2_9PLEO|nr:hypothetical protein DM02DRAFT_167231 [Periconia macrospinosa]
MTSLLTITPLDAEPLPLYSRRDPDSISLLSTAPSYVSETPTYNSTSYPAPTTSLPPLLPPLRPDQEVGRGLPAPRYAPGFQNRGNPSHVTMNLFASSNNARQYASVARRRANTQQANTTAMLNSLAAIPPANLSSQSIHNTLTSTSTTPPRSTSPSSSTNNNNNNNNTTSSTSLIPPTSPTSSSSLLFPPPLDSPTTPSPSSSSTSYPVRVGSSSDPLHPLEDPYLVGEEAADRARQQRVYREMCLRGEEAAGYESRSWDFMMGQMSDWEERRKLLIGRAW